jgi:hypothetical protein
MSMAGVEFIMRGGLNSAVNPIDGQLQKWWNSQIPGGDVL